MITQNDTSWKVADISATSHFRAYADRLDSLANSHLKRSNRYRLLGHAQKLLIGADVRSDRSGNPHRTRLCHTRTAHGVTDVTINLSKDELRSEATISGVQTCGCLWSCPVCVHKLMVEKGELIKKALAWADENGLIPVMVTLTASHNVGMSLAYFRDRFKASYQLFTNRRKWRTFKENFGVRHHIANVEITRGNAGWHYHKHMLLFLEKSVLTTAELGTSLQVALGQDWLDCLAKNDLHGLEDIALDVSTHGNVGNQYLTKIGFVAREGNLDFELTGQENKSGKTVWDLLKASYYGDKQASMLYLEFVREMTGENFLTCSHGLNDILEDFQLPMSDSEKEATTSEMVAWLDLSPRMWYIVKKAKIYHEILDIAARSRSVVKVIEHIRHTHDELLRLGQWIPPLHVKPEWINEYEGSE